MELSTSIEEPLSLMCIEVRASDGPSDARADYKALLVMVARTGVRRLLLDYTGMTVDISLDDFLEIRTRHRRLFAAIRAVKTAVVLPEELATTMILMAAMRTFGIRVAAFTDRCEARAWLVRDDAPGT